MTQSFNDRMKIFQQNKLHKNILKREEEYKNELTECTFKPKIHKNQSKNRNNRLSGNLSKDSKRRNVTEFLKDQSVFEHKKLKKLEKLSREREKVDCKTFRPKIDKRSKYLTESVRDSLESVPVYKRLHEISNSRCRNHTKSSLERKLTYQHQNKLISMKNKSRCGRNFETKNAQYVTENFNIGKLLREKKIR